jgi:hypothetical protein
MAIEHTSDVDAQGRGLPSSAKINDDGMKKMHQQDAATTLTDPNGCNILVVGVADIAKQGTQKNKSGRVCVKKVIV